MSVVVFEDERWKSFAPLSFTRHLSQLCWGTRTLLEAFRESMPGEEVILWGREALRQVTKERLSVSYNTKVEGKVVLLNARAHPSRGLRGILSKEGDFAAMAGEELVAARVRVSSLSPGQLSSKVLLAKSKSLDRLNADQDLLFRGSWDLVRSNGMAIAEQGVHGFPSAPVPDGIALKGSPSNVRAHERAEIDGLVSIDARLGPVVIDEQAAIESFTMLSGPCYVGPGSRIHSGMIRSGTSIFGNCRVGGEVENSIIMSHSNKAHVGYIGDSIVGEWVNIGAASTFSNLKNTYGTVRVGLDGKRFDTGMTKLGAVVGDMTKVSIGVTVFAGKSLGVCSHVAGLVDRDIPAFTYYSGGVGRMVELRLDSALETQRRMMECRGGAPSKGEEELVRRVFEETVRERKKAGVRKGKI